MALSGFLHRVSTHSSFRTAHSSPDREVPLETIPRRSSDIVSQRHLSEAANLGQRIQDDINSGQYECGICMDKVTRDSAIWFCKTCWNVCHHDCMQKCAAGGANRTVAPGRGWKCPSCRAGYSGPPRLTCCEPLAALHSFLIIMLMICRVCNFTWQCQQKWTASEFLRVSLFQTTVLSSPLLPTLPCGTM